MKFFIMVSLLASCAQNEVAHEPITCLEADPTPARKPRGPGFEALDNIEQQMRFDLRNTAAL